MANIPPNELRDWLSYDPATGLFRWRRTKNNRVSVGTVAGTINSDGYRRIFFERRSYAAHHLAWWFHSGEWPKTILDHINGNRSDDRVDNLRLASASGNARNRRSATGSSSQYLGVSRYRGRCWSARINTGGRMKYLGYFDDEVAAALAYDAAARQYHGEFARPNFAG